MTGWIVDAKSAGLPRSALRPGTVEASHASRMMMQRKIGIPCHILVSEYHNKNDRHASSRAPCKNAGFVAFAAPADAPQLCCAGFQRRGGRCSRRGAAADVALGDDGLYHEPWFLQSFL